MSFSQSDVEIVPAIIGTDFAAVRGKIAQLDGRVPWVSLDILDGKFAPSTSWRQPADLKDLDGQIKIEVHLMVEHPEDELKAWLEVADRVVVHHESTEVLPQVLQAIRDSSSEVGLALLLPTPLEVLAPFMALVDLVQLMGIAEIGYQGQAFEPRVLARVKSLRASYPDVKIAVDGGVGPENVADLSAAGATNLIVGSAIWQAEDPLESIRQLYALARRQN